jgi:hypothetical protein
VEFEWNEAKSRGNRKKHGVSFDEARELFEGGREYAEFFDGRYPPGEDRFRAIGPVARGVILVVYAEPKENTIRIISARPATGRELKLYIDYIERMFPHG